MKISEDKDIHTVPTDAQGREHELSVDCWCVPYLDYVNEETEVKHYIHKGYEELEQ